MLLLRVRRNDKSLNSRNLPQETTNAACRLEESTYFSVTLCGRFLSKEWKNKLFGSITLNRNNSLENMKGKYMRQRFISGLLVTLGISSLALLRLQNWVLTEVGSKNPMDLPDLNSRFGGWAYFWWPDMVQVSLLLALSLTTVVALFSLRLSERRRTPSDNSDDRAVVANRPATNLYGNPVGAGLN
jgi:hypothetical protein